MSAYFPSLLISPPSSTGISRLSPAPEAAEPVVRVLPGNLLVTDSSTPDSVATGYGKDMLAWFEGLWMEYSEMAVGNLSSIA